MTSNNYPQRIRMGASLFLLAIFTAHPSDLTNAAEAAKPNILWISCEDICPDLGCYGDSYAQTPHLDQLARQGCRYTNAFVTFPVCAPSRSSIITGVHPGTLGTMHMRTGNKAGNKGYEAVIPPEVKCFTEYLRAAGYYCSNHTKTDYQFASPLTAWDAVKGDWQNRDRAVGQPFFSVINLVITHESQAWNIAKVNHDPAKVVVPPFYPDTPVVRRNLAKYYDNITTMDAQAGEILDRLAKDGLAENTVVFFWSDHGRGLPRYKRWPYETGLHVPLIIRWPGKIKPGSVCDDLTCLIDLAPTLLGAAGIKIPSYMQGRTLLGDHKGLPPQYVFGGRNRMDPTNDDFVRTCRDRRYRYIHNFTPELPYAQELPYLEKMPIMREWRRLNAEGKLVGPQKLFFQTSKPAEELYDCVDDPYNVRNLAAAPDYQTTLQRMRTALDQWMKTIGDLGGVPEDQLIERMWPGGKQPITAVPVFHVRKGADNDVTVEISCPTEGASIAYRLAPEGRWLLYHEPLHVKRGVEVQATAIRIGFKPSRKAIEKTADNTAAIRVDAGQKIGAIRAIQGVNGGPICFGGLVDLTKYHRAPGIPLTRIHDANWPRSDVVDIHAIFPNFSADADSPGSYHFAPTDDYLKSIRAVGSDVMYRLGESIEHTPRKYYVHKPADFDQWTKICLGIIRHYNENWDDGFRFNLRYFEIWNEAEIGPLMWDGTSEDYYRLYATAAKAIKARYPKLMVGGPAAAGLGRLDGDRLTPTGHLRGFLDYCRKQSLPLDFLSWHTYSGDPTFPVRGTIGLRRILNQYGFQKTEIHLNEWNYCPYKGLGLGELFSRDGARMQKCVEDSSGPQGAAYAACVLLGLQDAPLDMANFYTGDNGCLGMFNVFGVPNKTYHAFRAFKALVDHPQRLAVAGGKPGELNAAAGSSKDGRELAVVVSNFKAADGRIELTVANLPWTGPSECELLLLDQTRNLEPIQKQEQNGRTIRITQELPAPGVLLLYVRPRQQPSVGASQL